MTAKNFAEGKVVCVDATHGTNAYNISSCLVHNKQGGQSGIDLSPVAKWRQWGMFIHLGKQIRVPPNAVQVRMPPALIS